MQLLTELQAEEQTTTTFSLSVIIRRPHPKTVVECVSALLGCGAYGYRSLRDHSLH
jgi:hypothetical protein